MGSASAAPDSAFVARGCSWKTIRSGPCNRARIDMRPTVRSPDRPRNSPIVRSGPGCAPPRGGPHGRRWRAGAGPGSGSETLVQPAQLHDVVEAFPALVIVERILADLRGSPIQVERRIDGRRRAGLVHEADREEG